MADAFDFTKKQIDVIKRIARYEDSMKDKAVNSWTPTHRGVKRDVNVMHVAILSEEEMKYNFIVGSTPVE